MVMFRNAADPALAACSATYALASLTHFAHNGLYAADYPNLPQWVTPALVGLTWLAITAIGVLGGLALRWGAETLGFMLLACYAAFGFDAFAHYGLAGMREHTLVMNLTIWGEGCTGALLFAAALVRLRRRVSPSPSASG